MKPQKSITECSHPNLVMKKFHTALASFVIASTATISTTQVSANPLPAVQVGMGVISKAKDVSEYTNKGNAPDCVTASDNPVINPDTPPSVDRYHELAAFNSTTVNIKDVEAIMGIGKYTTHQGVVKSQTVAYENIKEKGCLLGCGKSGLWVALDAKSDVPGRIAQVRFYPNPNKQEFFLFRDQILVNRKVVTLPVCSANPGASDASK